MTEAVQPRCGERGLALAFTGTAAMQPQPGARCAHSHSAASETAPLVRALLLFSGGTRHLELLLDTFSAVNKSF